MKFQSNVFNYVRHKVCIHQMHCDAEFFDCDRWKPQTMYISNLATVLRFRGTIVNKWIHCLEDEWSNQGNCLIHESFFKLKTLHKISFCSDKRQSLMLCFTAFKDSQIPVYSHNEVKCDIWKTRILN